MADSGDLDNPDCMFRGRFNSNNNGGNLKKRKSHAAVCMSTWAASIRFASGIPKGGMKGQRNGRSSRSRLDHETDLSLSPQEFIAGGAARAHRENNNFRLLVRTKGRAEGSL